MEISLFLVTDPAGNTGVFDFVDISEFCSTYKFSVGDVKACLAHKRKGVRGWTFKWYGYPEPDSIFTKRIHEDMDQDFTRVPIVDAGLILFSRPFRGATEREKEFFTKVANASGFVPIESVTGCMGRLDLPDKNFTCKVFWLTGLCEDRAGGLTHISVAPRMK